MATEESESGTSQRDRPAWKRIRRAIILYVFVPYLAVTAIFTVLQRRLMYRPTVVESLRIADVSPDVDIGIDVDLITADGNSIRGWLIHGQRGNQHDHGKAPLVLYFPGNAQNRHDRIDDLREVASCGFDVLIFDYRGFGDSDGSPTESSLTADARLVWQYACESLGYHANRIVVFGESLGGAVALSMWSETNPDRPQPAALILNSTFASMSQTVEWQYPLFPFQFLLLDRWPSIKHIGRVQTPVVVFHGTSDELIPIAHARALAATSSSARFIEVPCGGHNQIPMRQLRRELESLLEVIAAASHQAATQ